MDEVAFPPAFTAEFEVLEVVGAGGMARVYRARQRTTGREVAIKLLAPQAFSEEDARKRFEREREVTSGLKHPHIVPLLSFGDAAGRPYLVFEFVDGQSLRDMLLRERKIPLVRALRYARHVAEGLAAAHAAGIVHRDLKPDNVLVARSDDAARVADFGLARETAPAADKPKLTQTGIILGTPGYLSPEMIRGEAATPAADLFSLGIMLYEMITGQLPLASTSDHELLIRYLREDMPPLSARGADVPQRVERLVATLLRRDVARRPDDAAKVAEALAQAEAKGDAPDSVSTREGRPRSKPSALTRPMSLSAGRGPSLTPRSTGRLIARQPRAYATGMLVALVVAGFVALGYLGWPAAAKPRAQILGTPTVIAGATSASIRWQTDQPVETVLRIRPDGQPATLATEVRPPAGAPPNGVTHEITVRGLTQGQRWVFALDLPDAGGAAPEFPVELRGDLRAMVDGASVHYLDAARLEVSFELKAEVTAGVLFAGAKDAAPVWAPGRGPRRVTLAVPVPADGAAHPPVVVFRELDDEPAGGENVRNRVELPRFVPLDHLRRQVQELFTTRPPLDLTLVTGEIFRVASKVYGVPRDRTITKEQVRKLDEAKRAHLIEAARAMARQKLFALRQLDLDLVTDALPLWGPRAALAPADRRRLHAALMHLADLDGACELVAGAPLLDVDRRLGLRVPPPLPRVAPPGVFRPLEHFAEPLVQQVLQAQALPLFNHTDFGAGENVMGIWVVAGNTQNVVEAVRALAITTPDDPKGHTGIAERLPRLPADFPVDGPLRIRLAASSIAPEYRLWLRFGQETDVCFRCTLADYKGFGAEPMRSLRPEIVERQVEMMVDLPAGYVEPGARDLSVRLEAFPTHDGGNVAAPMLAWITELELIPLQ